jgi:hypothetical protein
MHAPPATHPPPSRNRPTRPPARASPAPPRLAPHPPTTPPGLGKLGHAILTFRRWSDEYRYVPRFLVCFIIMIAELLFENCMVW